MARASPGRGGQWPGGLGPPRFLLSPPAAPLPRPSLDTVCLFCFQLTLTIVRQTGGLGISIAGGKGSTPYKGDDEVSSRCCPAHSVLLAPLGGLEDCGVPVPQRMNGDLEVGAAPPACSLQFRLPSLVAAVLGMGSKFSGSF